MRLAAEGCHPGEGRDRRWVERWCESIADDPGLRPLLSGIKSGRQFQVCAVIG